MTFVNYVIYTESLSLDFSSNKPFLLNSCVLYRDKVMSNDDDDDDDDDDVIS